MTVPLPLRYEGEGCFAPVSAYWGRRADLSYVVGETYRLVEHHERSDASHSHYFAAVKNGFDSLPDRLREEYPTADHLRKKLLIRCGYADERSIVCASKAEAQRVAAFVKPMDEYAIVVVREAVVRVFTAQSQSYRAMGRQTFQESKTKVLDAIDDLLGTDRGATARSEAA